MKYLGAFAYIIAVSVTLGIHIPPPIPSTPIPSGFNNDSDTNSNYGDCGYWEGDVCDA